MKKEIILISGHYYGSKRRAGFHFLASTFANMGNKILFVTAPYSYLFKLKKYHLKDYSFETNKVVRYKRDEDYYIHATLFHIANMRLKWLNFLSRKLYRIYQILPLGRLNHRILTADIIIFESTPGLFLFHKMKRKNSQAKMVYRVSDDFENLNVHPSLIEYEKKILDQFDLVSVPSRYIFDQIKQKNSKTNLYLQYHGIDKELFTKKHENPYNTLKTNAIFIGVAKLDYEFLEYVGTYEKNITFHIIGPIENKIIQDNIVYYGEMQFESIIKYIIHADIGMHTIMNMKGVKSLTDSLKVHQYTFCGLPIIAPKFLKTDRDNTFYYDGTNDSISIALKACMEFNKSRSRSQAKNSVLSWKELASDMLKLLE